MLFVFRFGKDRKSAAAWEWRHLQISLWDYWSVLFRRWCKFSTSEFFKKNPVIFKFFSCLVLTYFLFPRLMKIPDWSLTPIKAGPTTLIQLPACKQRNLISESQDIWFNQLHGYSDLTPRHSSISPPTWQPGTEGFTQHHFNMETRHWRIYSTPASALGLFCFYLLFFFLKMLILHWTQQPLNGFLVVRQPLTTGNLHQEEREPAFSASASKRHMETKLDGGKSLCGKIELPICHVIIKTKTSTFSVTSIYTHFLTLRICVHTSVRSHHITHGEENTAVCL